MPRPSDRHGAGALRSAGGALRRNLGVLVSELARRVLPGGRAARGAASPLRGQAPGGGAPRRLPPAAARGAVPPLGRADASRLPLRREALGPRGRGRCRRRLAVRRAGPPARGPARARARPASRGAEAGRPSAGGTARHPRRSRGLRGGTRGPELGGPRGRRRHRRRGSRARGSADWDGDAPLRYLRLREPPYDDEALEALAARVAPLVARGLDIYCFFRHEDEPRGALSAERLLTLV